MNELLDAALSYARAGLPVFPMLSRSKGFFSKSNPDEGKPGHLCSAPLHQHGFKDATPDLATVEAWWREHPYSNIALATGRGLDVLDVDGPEGEKALEELVARRWTLPETCETRTGREGGGRHIYFRSAGWRNTRAVLGPKLDTRGLGGLVLLPPSVHPSGAVYTWANSSEPALAPAWLTALLYRGPETVAPPLPPRERSSDEDDPIERASQYLADMPAAISGQGGHDATFAAARALRGFGLTEADVLELLITEYNQRCVPPWRESDLRHKAREAFRAAKKIPDLRGSMGRAS